MLKREGPLTAVLRCRFALAVLVTIAGLAWQAGNAKAQDVLDVLVEARYEWSYSTGLADGRGLLGLIATFTNSGLQDLSGLTVLALRIPGLFVVPGDNALVLGALGAGESRTVLWELEYYGALLSTDFPLMIIAQGEALDYLGEAFLVPVDQRWEAVP